MMSWVCRSEHITPVLLHCLPVSQRVVFKTALMVWKCVHGVAPAYLSDLCVLATANSCRHHLRSAATGTLLVPRAWTATGQRSFTVNGPTTWNVLPPAPRSLNLSESAFKRALKTHLFSTAWRHWDVFMILAPDINIQNYLRTYLPHSQGTQVQITQLRRQLGIHCRMNCETRISTVPPSDATWRRSCFDSTWHTERIRGAVRLCAI